MKSWLYITLLLLLAACGEQPKPAENTATEVETPSTVALSASQMQHAGIEIGGVEQRPMSRLLRLSGAVDVPPQNMVSVSFPLGGYLKSSKLLPGMYVRKGEELAVLEDVQFIQLQQDYLLAKSQLALHELEYQRQETLAAGKAGSDKAFQQAKTDFETQRIALRALAEKLRLIGLQPEQLTEEKISRSIPVRSPINGYVSKVSVNIGKYTSPTDVLFELVNPQDIHLSLTAFEKDVALLSAGQRVEAWTNDQPMRRYGASVLLVSKNLDENRTAAVHCHFDRYDEKLLPGMFMNAEVSVKVEKAWAVPESAVVRWENQHYVFVAEGEGKFDMTPVQLGIQQDGLVQILPEKDLNGKQLALKNAYSLLMKLKNQAED